MKIELEVKVDGERFYYNSAEESLTRGPDGKWNVREPLTPETAIFYLHSMTEEAKEKFLFMVRKYNELSTAEGSKK